MTKRANSGSLEPKGRIGVPADALPQSQVILRGEDEEHYRRVLNEVTRNVAPADIIEQFWVRDVIDLLWEALRLRRLKGSLLQAATGRGLHKVLEPHRIPPA